jgi:hypothetical protein
VHKLFIIVSGGCSKASDDFYNHVLDCHGEASAGQCATSQVCFQVFCRICILHCGEAILTGQCATMSF